MSPRGILRTIMWRFPDKSERGRREGDRRNALRELQERSIRRALREFGETSGIAAQSRSRIENPRDLRQNKLQRVWAAG